MAILMTGVQSAASGLNTLGAGQLDIARTSNQRAYQNALIRDERDHMEQEHQRRRSERKVDAAEERRRTLTNMLASLGFQGDTSKLSESDLSREIAKRTRDQTVQWQEEDRQRLLDHEISRAKRLSEATLRHEAEVAGVPNATTAPLAEVQSALATARVDAEVALQKARTLRSLQSAQNTPEIYQPLRNALGQKLRERALMIGEASLPVPEFNPLMTDDERAMIWEEIANFPAVQAELSKLKDGEQRLDALRKGDFVAATKGLKSKVTDRLGMEWATYAPVLESRILKAREGKYSAGLRQYLARLQTLSQRLGRVDKDIDELYSIGAKEGINFGLALRLEDPDALIAEGVQAQEALPPLGGDPPTADPDSSVMPLPSTGLRPVDASAKPTGHVTGILPTIGNFFSDLGSAYAESPLMREGANDLATAGIQVLDVLGSAYGHGKTALLGGVPPEPLPFTPIDPLLNAAKGVVKMPLGPVQTIGDSYSYLLAPTSPSLPRRQDD